MVTVRRVSPGQRGVKKTAGNSSSTSSSNSTNSTTTTPSTSASTNTSIGGTTGTGNSTTGTEDNEPIENKHNNLTKYWNIEEGPMYMNDDTPSVEIYISREKPVETENEAEDGETMEEEKELEEAVSHDPKLLKQVENDKDINNNNTTVVKLNDQQMLVYNAIDRYNI